MCGRGRHSAMDKGNDMGAWKNHPDCPQPQPEPEGERPMLDERQQRMAEVLRQAMAEIRPLELTDKVDAFREFFSGLKRSHHDLQRALRRVKEELDRVSHERESWNAEALDELTDLFEAGDRLDDELLSIAHRMSDL